MTKDRLWIGTSWKMNKTLDEAKAFATALARVNNADDTQIQRFVIPPFTVVRDVKQLLAHAPIKVGAQNMHWADSGAWTGEVSPIMLKDCQLDIVELGHSERREHFGETNETVGLKVEAAARHGLIPLICVGESRKERDSGKTESALEEQLLGAFKQLTKATRSAPILLAYEPVWAIGEGGTPASSSYANERHSFIATIATEALGRPVPCLYGGSVNSSNCVELIQQPAIDGLFIGRAAWDVAGYLSILKLCSSAITVNRGEKIS